jgi:hypothetical protein
MSKTVVFCSTHPLPSESFPEAMLRDVARSFNADKSVGFLLKAKSDWKQFLNDAELGEIIIVGVDDPSDYEIPLDGLTPMSTHVNNKLVPCKFQIVERKGVLVFSSEDLLQIQPA